MKKVILLVYSFYFVFFCSAKWDYISCPTSFEFSPEDSLSLYQVAEQHPHLGGTAVYDARVMLGLDFFDFGDDQQKNQLNSSEDVEFSIQSQFEHRILLYPNPASSVINYEIDLFETENADLFIYDMMGREVQLLKLNSDNLHGSIDVSYLSSGIYHYELRPELGQSIKGIIVIFK